MDRTQHTLLIVNDDPASRYATARVLRAAGFKTVEAGSGHEALALADESMSAMVLDIHLPDIDGFTLANLLRERNVGPRLPILHLSAAFVKDEDKVRGLDAGADAYLTHPVEPAVLVATVQALVRTRMAEQNMRRSEAKFRAIYAQAPGGIGLLDRDGVLLDANPALLGLLGRDSAAVVGKRVADFVAPEAHEAALGFMAGFLAAAQGQATGETVAAEFTVGERTLEWMLSPYVEPGVTMLLVTDVSERKAIERERQQMLDREREARGVAEHLSRMKDDFIAVLSHELRTPLSAVLAWTHVLLKTRRGDPAMLERGLEAIDRNTRLQATLVSDLLDVSRMNTGKTRLDLAPVALPDLVESVVATARQSAEAARHPVTVSVDGPTPFPTLQADATHLTQVLTNLLGNAMKFSPPDTPVRVEVALAGEEAVIRVIDAGQGIEASFLPHLFDRFAQADAASNRKRGGLGLGLSIARHLVEAHGGSIAAHSAGPGQGATFEARLPLRPPESATDTPDEAEGDPSDALRDLDLLIVDDDPDASALLQLILGDRGARVRIAHDADSALAALAARRPDLLISDVGMPGKDGYALIRDVRRREQAAGDARVPAIALTAFGREQDRLQALDAGFDAHCAKPLRPQELVHLVRRLAA